MIKKINIILLIAIITAVSTIVVYGAVTSGFTGSAFFSQARADKTQFTSDGLVGKPILFYNSTTERVELDDYAPVALTMVTGGNADLALPDGSTFLVTGPGGAFNLEGMTGGVDGRRIVVYNPVAQNMTVENEEATSTAAYRITTNTGADVVTTAAGCFTFIYDGGTSRWLLITAEL